MQNSNGPIATRHHIIFNLWISSKTRTRNIPRAQCSGPHHFSWNFVQIKAKNKIYIMLFESHRMIDHKSRTYLMKIAKTHWARYFRVIIHACFIKSKALKRQKHSMNIKHHDSKLKSYNARLEIKIQS